MLKVNPFWYHIMLTYTTQLSLSRFVVRWICKNILFVHFDFRIPLSYTFSATQTDLHE